MAQIVKAARCILPGGRFALMGFDSAGKEVFGLGHRAKDAASGIRWVRAGTGRADLQRIQREYAAWLKGTFSEEKS